MKPARAPILLATVRYTKSVYEAFIAFFLVILLGIVVVFVAPINILTLPFGSIFLIVLSAICVLYGFAFLIYRLLKRTNDLAHMMQVLLDGLGQGFFVFDSRGVCGTICSRVCEELLGIWPADQALVDVIHVPQDQRNDIMEWINVIFQPDHALAFEDIVSFLPTTVPRDDGRHITLEWRAIRDSNNVIKRVAVIVTDRTDAQEASQEAKKQQDFVEMMSRIFRERNQFFTTLMRLSEFIDTASLMTSMANFDEALRQIHTLKAAARHFHLVTVAKALHDFEGILRENHSSDPQENERIFHQGIQPLARALIVLNGEIRTLLGEGEEWSGHARQVNETDLYDFAQYLQQNRVPSDVMNHYVARLLAVPIRDCFHTFERDMLDLVRIIGKRMKPVLFEGQNPRILALPMQPFFFSLTHIARNIVDHGFEAPATRLARGKDEAGQVIVRTELFSETESTRQSLRIVICDDGGGIDPNRIRARLVDLDPQGTWRNDDDHAIIQHIFTWGLTTASHVTELSGRGVGLEVVAREVRKLGGTIKVHSVFEVGTTFEIIMPWSLDLV